MHYMLARLKGVRIEDVEQILKRDIETHAREGIYLEHLWQNLDEEDDVYFLFRINDVKNVKDFINRVHLQARDENPDTHIPHMTYLQGRTILPGL